MLCREGKSWTGGYLVGFGNELEGDHEAGAGFDDVPTSLQV